MIDWTKPLVAGVGVPRVVAGASSDGTRYVLHADGERRWHGPDGALAGIYRPDDEYINKYRLRNVAAPEPADIEAIIADVLAAHEAGRAENERLRAALIALMTTSGALHGRPETDNPAEALARAALAGTPPESATSREFRPEPGWLKRDVDRAAKRMDDWFGTPHHSQPEEGK